MEEQAEKTAAPAAEAESTAAAVPVNGAVAQPAADAPPAADKQYGKFKDADALYEAYRNLESEFTRRSQKLKEMEAKLRTSEDENAAAPPLPPAKAHGAKAESTSAETEGTAAAPPMPHSGERAPVPDRETADKIIGEYLRNLLLSRPPAVIADSGAPPLSPQRVPRTLAEAGQMAQKMLILNRRPN